MTHSHTNTLAKWYIVQVVPKHEIIVKDFLENRSFENDNDTIEKVFVPLAHHITKSGSKKKKPLFPGYVFVKLQMTDTSWYTIRNTQYVTGIVGSSGQRTKPTPISEAQINKLIEQIANNEFVVDAGKVNTLGSAPFRIGDLVEAKEGNFKGQIGKVIELSLEKQVAVIELEVFGRLTPVTLPISELHKK